MKHIESWLGMHQIHLHIIADTLIKGVMGPDAWDRLWSKASDAIVARSVTAVGLVFGAGQDEKEPTGRPKLDSYKLQ